MTRLENSLARALHSDEGRRAALIELDRLDCEESFAEFVKQAWDELEPGTPLRWNWHIDTVCGYLEAFSERKIKRLIINIPPGTMKSLLVSVFYPAWIWAKQPTHRFLTVANGDNLAVRDAQRMKWLIESDWFQERWPMAIARDQSGKALFGNSQRGVRQAIGITGNVTGLRGDTQLWDDLLDAMKAFSDKERATVIDAIDQKLSNRLNDPVDGGICLIMQRLHEEDPTGHLMKSLEDKWTLLVIPMEWECEQRFDAGKDIGRPELNDPRTVKGELLDKNRYDIKTLSALKERLGTYGTAGQLQQRPNPIGGGIIKKSWWRKWPEGKQLPFCIHVVASYDTAFTEKETKDASYSARTTWGIFENEQTGKHDMILLEGWWERVGYPALRKQAKAHHRGFNVDRNLIEKKASGQSLLQDLRKIRIPVYGYNPGKLDKVSRTHVASPLFEAGQVWYPDRKWAEAVIDYVSSFPNGAAPSGDINDTVTQAALYLKKGWWINPPDEDEDEKPPEERSDEWDEDNGDDGYQGGAYG